MQRLHGRVFLFGLAVSLLLASSSNAAVQLFAGQWQKSGSSEASIGIIQHGETVAIFSKKGWAMALLRPQSNGLLASGEGKWILNAQSASVRVNVTIGYRNECLYLLASPKDGSGSAEYKLIMERVEPEETPIYRKA